MSRNNILISCVGRRVELLKYFKNSLVKISQDAKIFASDLNPNLSSACYFADDIIKTLPIGDDNYIDNLITACIKNDIGLIIPTIDTELLVLSQNTQVRRYFYTHLNPMLSECRPLLQSRAYLGTRHSQDAIGWLCVIL